MAAPQRGSRASAPARPVARTARRPGVAQRRKTAGHRRRFAVVVVVPVLLMLGSVYLHTVSAGLADRVAVLEERLARAEAERERLEVRVAELSGADRIRSLAEKLGMQDPGGTDLEVYDGRVGTDEGGEEKGGKPR
jgi:cell division protein DivIC